MEWKALQAIIEQIGRPSERREIRRLALSAADLPGDSWVVHERVRRAGYLFWKHAKDRAEFQRARKAGGFAITRLIEQPPSRPHSGVWYMLEKCASAEDAKAIVRSGRDFVSVVPGVTVLSTSDEVDVDVPTSDSRWVFECSVANQAGPMVNRIVFVSKDVYYFTLICSALNDPWPWEQIAELAALQVERITKPKDE